MWGHLLRSSSLFPQAIELSVRPVRVELRFPLRAQKASVPTRGEVLQCDGEDLKHRDEDIKRRGEAVNLRGEDLQKRGEAVKCGGEVQASRGEVVQHTR